MIMKILFKLSVMAFLSLIWVNLTEAQGWAQGRKGTYSAGIGVAQGIFVPVPDETGHTVSSHGVSFNISGEYHVHRFLGLGWQTGMDIFVEGHYYSKPEDIYYTSTAVGFPIGFKFNVHILEAANAPISNDLDVYAGFNVGGGPAFHGDPYGGAYGFFYVGPQAGVRYWIDSKVGVFGELGWGATIVNFGVSF
jgi:hypothetical protein